ncbi:MAG: hypothetical protein LKI94_08115 [Sporolactobacillus sp.]|nr:hypothetical protein [Sporolactobacillus sp.]MCI1882140.1 hypothetical protein [Sporolactobacillus sp.]
MGKKEKVIVVKGYVPEQEDPKDKPADRPVSVDPCKKHRVSEDGLVYEAVTDQSLFCEQDPRPLLSNRFAELSVDVKDPSSRVLLEGVVEWKPDSLSLLGGVIGIINAGIILGIPAVIRVWKKNANGSKPIAESRDAAQLFAVLGDILNTDPTDEIRAVDFAYTSTPFHAVDNNPDCGKNKYFLTIDLDTSIIPGTFLTNIIGLVGEPPKLSSDNVRNYSFTALEIGANPDKSCD